MCTLAGVKVGFPMLDERLVAFAGTLPTSMKLKGLRLRYFFKEALRDFLPRRSSVKASTGSECRSEEVARTDKKLHDFTGDRLTALKQREIFNKAFMEDLILKHREEHATYYGVMIWSLLILELWMDAHKKP